MKRHAERACNGATLSKQKMYIIAWTDDPAKAKAMRELGQPVAPGFHSSTTGQVTPAPFMFTHRTLLENAAILAAGSEDEKAVMCGMVRGKVFDVVSVRGRLPVRGACARLFTACKLGAAVPVALRNMGVRGNDVVYKDEDDVSVEPKGRMGSRLLVWLLRVLRDALVEAIDEEEDATKARALEQLWTAWYEHGKHSLQEAAEAYDTDRDRFDSLPKPTRDMIRGEARGLAHMLGRLPKLSASV